jgi:hypothetical protein
MNISASSTYTQSSILSTSFSNQSPSDSSIQSNDSPSTLSKANQLELPFCITNNPKVIEKVKYYYDKFSTVIWYKHQTYEDYLYDIKQLENKYFNVKDYSLVALNTLIVKHIMDIKFKMAEHIKTITYFQMNEIKILSEIKKLIEIQGKQIQMFNKYFDQTYEPALNHADQYYRYISSILKKQNKTIHAYQINRYSIKIEIELEIQQTMVEDLTFDWKCNTYDEINGYYENQ